jgi:hypothetical protein
MTEQDEIYDMMKITDVDNGSYGWINSSIGDENVHSPKGLDSLVID